MSDRSAPPAVKPLSIGILGAAKIAPKALIEPARRRSDVAVVAVAARDPARARAYAAEHGIPRVLPDYGALVADPAIDAVYVALPNGLHGRFTEAALTAGKHVLLEKPSAANADEGAHLVALAARADRVLMEAFHYFFHPLTARWRGLLREGAVGELRRVSASFHTHLPEDDVRFQFAHAGGSTMDLGCYCLHALRWATGAEPEVVAATAVERPRGIDVSMRARLAFPQGVSGDLACGMDRPEGFACELVVEGTAGRLRVENPFLPHLGHRLQVTGAVELDERVAGGITYDHQLEAFLGAVRRAVPPPTGGADAVCTLRAIDAVYIASGLGVRQPTP